MSAPAESEDTRGAFLATHPEHGSGLVAWFRGDDPCACQDGGLRAIFVHVEPRHISAPFLFHDLSEDELAVIERRRAA